MTEGSVALRDRVYTMLAAGRTIAQVCATTGVPRRAVVQLGREFGMRINIGRDRFDVVGQRPRAGSVAELLARAEASPRQRTQTLAARARSVLIELERCVEQDDVAKAQGTYDVGHVRRWAREQGIDVPERGRYLPAHVVQAWRLAGEP
ncbi:Lsr2 family DNA-binding protein [Cellulosimicrobium sp. 22601]|uniref:Lsr2 family DNA-binding protein n=1 Tax=unclassified Cellulosimicrobium TaxID=2624466 RepID=UPI003F82589C